MRKQICNIKNRVLIIVAYGHFNNISIFLHNSSVKSKRYSYPLIFSYSAVIMSFQKRNTMLFIKWIWFYVDARGINVASHNVHSFFKFFLACYCKNCILTLVYIVILCSCLYFLQLFDVHKTFFFSSSYYFFD
ncbi:hypothetical protein DSECCO2_507750 [anaerobic digester metagenome]